MKNICLAQIVAFVFDATTVSMQCSNDAQLSNDYPMIQFVVYTESLEFQMKQIPLVMAGHDVLIPTHRQQVDKCHKFIEYSIATSRSVLS